MARPRRRPPSRHPRVAIFGPRPARLDAGRRHERADMEEAAAARGSKRATMEPEPQSPAAPWRARRRPRRGVTAASAEVPGPSACGGAPARPPTASSADECERSCDHAAQVGRPAGQCSLARRGGDASGAIGASIADGCGAHQRLFGCKPARCHCDALAVLLRERVEALRCAGKRRR